MDFKVIGSNYTFSKRDFSYIPRHAQIKTERIKKTFHANGNQRKIGVGTLI